MTTETLPQTEKVGDEQFYNKLHDVMYAFILPIVLALGFFGNLMNMFILTGRRIQHSLRNNEKSANTGLIALTVSDLAFCLTAFPTTFLPADNTFIGDAGFYAYYGLYSPFVVSVFIMASTWLTVALAVERYRAICKPLSSRRIVSNFRTIFLIVFIFIFSVFFNVPLFLKYEFQTSYINNSNSCLTSENENFETHDLYKNSTFLIKSQENNSGAIRGFHSSNQHFVNSSSKNTFLFDAFYFNLNQNSSHNNCENLTIQKITTIRSITNTDDISEHVSRLLWGIFGNAIPLITLVFCNTTLLFAIHKSYALRRQMSRSWSKSSTTSCDHDSSQRITITLVCIVAMFLVLVAPSEAIKYCFIFLSSNLDTNFHFKSIEVITNVMQAINFSANFILYCIVNPSFRKTMFEMITFKKRLGKASTGNLPIRPLSITSIKGSPKQLQNKDKSFRRVNTNNQILGFPKKNFPVTSSLVNNGQDNSSNYKHVLVRLTEESFQDNI